jgi:hypothetical protein
VVAAKNSVLRPSVKLEASEKSDKPTRVRNIKAPLRAVGSHGAHGETVCFFLRHGARWSNRNGLIIVRLVFGGTII